MWDPRSWVQARPSFPRPIAPPTAGPCDPPYVCVRFNEQYAAIIAGAMSQLTQRTTWLASSEDELQGILANMTLAIELIGTAVQCDNIPAIGPGGEAQACNIAAYLANYVVRQSIGQALQQIQNESEVFAFAQIVLSLIPGFGAAFPITLAALNALFQTASGLDRGNLQTAIDDETLWGLETCAIYNAIKTDGQVTPVNFPTIVSNVCAITYSLPGISAMICQYVTDLGAQGLLAVQPPGAMISYDCTNCGGTGPLPIAPGPQPQRISFKDVLSIAIGASDAVLPILFPRPFASPPLLTTGCDNEDLIASFENTTPTGTTLRITAAAPVLALTTGTVDWTAEMPGSS